MQFWGWNHHQYCICCLNFLPKKHKVNSCLYAHLPFNHTIGHFTPWCALHPIGHRDADIRHLGCHERLAKVELLLRDKRVMIGGLLWSVATGRIGQRGQRGQSEGLQVCGVGGGSGGYGLRQKLSRVAWITVHWEGQNKKWRHLRKRRYRKWQNKVQIHDLNWCKCVNPAHQYPRFLSRWTFCASVLHLFVCRGKKKKRV